jgi:hypothetical protein
MKLEFLPEGSRDCPLIRLYEFSTADICSLRESIRALLDGSRVFVSLHNEPYFEPVASFQVRLKVSDRELGIKQIQPGLFESLFTRDGWETLADRLDPFCHGNSTGYQWLSDTGGIAFLISSDGKW